MLYSTYYGWFCQVTKAKLSEVPWGLTNISCQCRTEFSYSCSYSFMIVLFCILIYIVKLPIARLSFLILSFYSLCLASWGCILSPFVNERLMALY